MLLDSNVIIYAAQPGNERLRQFVADNATSCSAISRLEVLGYHKLSDEDEQLLQTFFAALEILSVLNAVIDRAIQLRRQRKRPVADSLIAATACISGSSRVRSDTGVRIRFRARWRIRV